MRRWTWGIGGVALTLALGVPTLVLATSDAGVGADRPRACRAFDASHDRARAASPVSARRATPGEGSLETLVVGDSYSSGWKLGDVASAWPARLAELLPARVRVAGYPGSGFTPHASDCGALSFADRAGPALGPGVDLVVVQGGLNDVDQPAADLEAGFAALVEELDGVPLVVVGPPAAPARRAGAARVDASLRELADLHDVPYVATAHLDLPYLPDDLHLTEAGHRLFAQAVAAALPTSVRP